MAKSKPSIEDQLTEAQIMITTLRTMPDLQIALSVYGYTAERIAEGELLSDTARTHYQQKITAYGGLRAAVDSLTKTEQQARATYMRHAKTARIALEKDRGALQTLHLSGVRKSSRAAWLVQAQQFYAAAIADMVIQQRLETVGITMSILQEGAQQVLAVTNELVVRRQQESVAHQSTRERDVMLDNLHSWLRDFKGVARVALKDHPAILEQLGVSVRS